MEVSENGTPPATNHHGCFNTVTIVMVIHDLDDLGCGVSLNGFLFSWENLKTGNQYSNKNHSLWYTRPQNLVNITIKSP